MFLLCGALNVRRQNGRGIAILLLDLDRFKTINDSLGHSTGDELLIAVGERIVRCLRSGDTAARLGGDESVILVEDVADLSEATGLAARVIEALSAPFLLSGRDVGISASVGIVLRPSDPAPGTSAPRHHGRRGHRASRSSRAAA